LKTADEWCKRITEYIKLNAGLHKVRLDVVEHGKLREAGGNHDRDNA
jgi:hypothetical protein